MKEESKRLKQLEERHGVLRKKTDMKVMETVDRYEKKESSLKQMLSTVKKDKRKIQETIVELDKHKLAALEATWQQVNGDFGGIFGDLLPGNTAKLEPPEGQDITEGLEVKVNLGGVWKQSLTELSGGQRLVRIGFLVVQLHTLTSSHSQTDHLSPSPSSLPFSGSNRRPCTFSTKSTPPWTCLTPKISDTCCGLVSKDRSLLSSRSRRACSTMRMCCSGQSLSTASVTSR